MIIKETMIIKDHIQKATPQDMHKIIMRSLNNSQHLSRSEPRKDAHLLWNQVSNNIIIIQHDDNISISLKDFHPVNKEEIPPLKDNENVRLTGKVSRLYNPHIPISQEEKDILQTLGYDISRLPSGTRKVPIPENELHRVMKNKLQSRNLEVSHIDCIIDKDLRINKTKKVPTCIIDVTLTGKSEDLNHLVNQGFGKAKNYGVGLLQIEERQL